MNTVTGRRLSRALLALGLLGASGGPAAAATAAEGTVQLRVFAHTAVATPTLELARETVTGLLESGGVVAEWRHCNTSDPGCGGTDAAHAITIRLLPTRLTGGHVCGQAARDLGGDKTVLVYVPRTTELARRIRLSAAGRWNPALATLEAGHLLGLAMAHEVGHALGLQHAAPGVMKARFEIADLLALRASRLAFSLPEGASMRQAMRQSATQVVAGGH